MPNYVHVGHTLQSAINTPLPFNVIIMEEDEGIKFHPPIDNYTRAAAVPAVADDDHHHQPNALGNNQQQQQQQQELCRLVIYLSSPLPSCTSSHPSNYYHYIAVIVLNV